MSSKEYINKIKEFPSPWNTFRLNEVFQHEFEGYSKEQFVIRDLIYKHFPDKPSISLGSLPPIISPIFWETISGRNREEIFSFKWKDKCITEATYQNQISMYDFWGEIVKINLINLSSYKFSIEQTFVSSNYSNKEIKESLERRINALELFKASINEGNWKNLLLVVPNDNIISKDISFTVTPNLDITLYRHEGLGKHYGKFTYYPIENDVIKKIWLRRWNEVINTYARNRADFPKYLLRPEDIPLFSDECSHFNINSLNIMKNSLLNLRNNIDTTTQLIQNMIESNSKQVDIVVYVALSEEFNYIIEEIGIELIPEEIEDIAITCFHGKLICDRIQKEINIVFVPSGKMGNTRASGVMSVILVKYKPKNVIVIGIAGSLDNDLHPGDIFIPDSVNEYLANSAAIGENEWDFQISGNHFNSTPRLINRFQQFVNTKRVHYDNWNKSTVDAFSSLISDEIVNLLSSHNIEIKRESKLYAGDDKVLASGPAVGKGQAFVKWLKTKVDRKALAIEMESAGIYDAVHIRSDKPNIISIRGISDFADDRKEQIEKSAKEKFRLLAIQNCTSLLKNAIIAGLFEE